MTIFLIHCSEIIVHNVFTYADIWIVKRNCIVWCCSWFRPVVVPEATFIGPFLGCVLAHQNVCPPLPLSRVLQELVQTKIECAELKEQQLVTQRQLYKAQETIREGSQGGSQLRQNSASGM